MKPQSPTRFSIAALAALDSAVEAAVLSGASTFSDIYSTPRVRELCQGSSSRVAGALKRLHAVGVISYIGPSRRRLYSPGPKSTKPASAQKINEVPQLGRFVWALSGAGLYFGRLISSTYSVSEAPKFIVEVPGEGRINSIFISSTVDTIARQLQESILDVENV